MSKSWAKIISIGRFDQPTLCCKQNATFSCIHIATVRVLPTCVARLQQRQNEKQRKYPKQALWYASYNELLEKASRALMYTPRLRCISSFVEKCINGKCPVYLNDVFAVNTGSNSRSSICWCSLNVIPNLCVTVFGIRFLAFGTLQNLKNGHWCARFLSATCVPWNHVNFYVHLCSSFCKYFIFTSENSPLTNVWYYIVSDAK